jgi:Arc/MetJ-type ribon-helix-helix transcriptional regulator
MSKITFRADDDLVRQLEEFDASKSEVMREALRFYLENAERDSASSDTTVDDALADRIDDLIDRRLDERLDSQTTDQSSGFTPNTPQDVNVNISLDGVPTEEGGVEAERTTDADARKTPAANADEGAQTERNTCAQCGEDIGSEHVYCPNCGEKASHRVFCDCGDELRSDWAFCPSCGRRTPAADVLDNR